jgi:uncharacterized protein YkwD
MSKCEECGREVALPFICSYCGGYYCDEHRLPESHECSNQPTVAPPFARPQTPSKSKTNVSPHSYAESTWGKPENMEKPRVRRHFPVGKVVGVILAVVIIGAFLWFSPTVISYVQSFLNPSSSVTYAELVGFSLTLINTDRTANGLSAVNLSSINSGQVHADDMLKNDYFSHWGTDGSKPYMRYTLAGGRGAVEENIAAYTQGAPSDREAALKNLENNMMNNDAASNWGHRDNILNPLHNEVSIGISYDNGHLYFVEDFINDYVQWSTFTVIQNKVSLAGTLSKQMTLSEVDIFYDSLPLNLTRYQLDNSPYNGAYTQGTFVGMALPPNFQSQQGITITAQSWAQAGLTFQIEFDMSQAFNLYGKGVYTIYLQAGSQDFLTTYSIWHE